MPEQLGNATDAGSSLLATDGTMSPAIVVIAALLVGLSVSGACFCALRAINGWAAGTQSTRTQRFHDEGEISASRQQTEMTNGESAVRFDDESPAPANVPKRKGKKARKNKGGPVLWHEDDEDDESGSLARGEAA